MNDYCPRCDEVVKTFVLTLGEVICGECSFVLYHVDE